MENPRGRPVFGDFTGREVGWPRSAGGQFAMKDKQPAEMREAESRPVRPKVVRFGVESEAEKGGGRERERCRHALSSETWVPWEAGVYQGRAQRVKTDS